MKRLLFISFALSLLLFSACSKSGNRSSISEADQIIESLEKYPDKWHAKTENGMYFTITGPNRVRLLYDKDGGAPISTDVKRGGITMVKPRMYFEGEELIQLKKALEPFVVKANEERIQENQSKRYQKIF